MSPMPSGMVEVVSADRDPVPVLGDDLVEVVGVFGQPSDVADQEQIRWASRHVSEELASPFRGADAERGLCNCVEGDHTGTIAPVFQLPDLPGRLSRRWERA